VERKKRKKTREEHEKLREKQEKVALKLVRLKGLEH